MTAEPGTLTPGPAVFSPAGHRPTPAQEPGDHGSTPAPAPAPSPLSRPTCTRLGLSWSGVVRTARSPGKPPIGVSDVMTSETLRSHETTQSPAPPAAGNLVRGEVRLVPPGLHEQLSFQRRTPATARRGYRTGTALGNAVRSPHHPSQVVGAPYCRVMTAPRAPGPCAGWLRRGLRGVGCSGR